MTRLSSNWTIFLKLFIPIFWGVFFGALCLAVLLSEPGDLSIFKSSSSRIVLVVCYVVFFFFLYLTLMRLVRADFDEKYIYISNYFKTYRYPFDSIESVRYENYSIFKLIRFRFSSKSKFGMQAYCLANKAGLEELKEANLVEVSL
jgi:hypothetical protein